MSNIHLVSTADNAIAPYSRSDFNRLSESVPFDVFREHALVDSPEDADVVLFVGSIHHDHRDVRSHPFLRHFKEKCFLYHSNDFVIPFLPGVYVNITKRWYSRRRVRSGFYMRVFNSDFITHVPSMAGCEHLFCFVGSTRTHPVRSRIMALKHSRAYLRDTTAAIPADERSKSFFMVDYKSSDNANYGSMLAGSKFVICPRGYAPSSWRLFETMKTGRVPVIVSDQWIPPEGPAWENFSIRVREKDVARIPDILEQHESSAETMGRLARKNWEDWFSKEVCFHRMAEWCLDIKKNRERLIFDYAASHIQLLRPFFVRHVLLPDIKRGLIGGQR